MNACMNEQIEMKENSYLVAVVPLGVVAGGHHHPGTRTQLEIQLNPQ